MDGGEVKPLHVRVAEALGWIDCRNMGKTWWGFSGPGIHAGQTEVPRYDTDWSATGPLIEKHEIGLKEDGCGYTSDERWRARADYYAPNPNGPVNGYGGTWATAEARGATPLIAVCNLILALKEAGEL